MGEGTLARLAHRGEARHVAFGTEHMRYVFAREPEMRLPDTRRFAGVVELQREMDRSRRERLQSLGFEPAVATSISAYHTKNFM